MHLAPRHDEITIEYLDAGEVVVGGNATLVLTALGPARIYRLARADFEAAALRLPALQQRVNAAVLRRLGKARLRLEHLLIPDLRQRTLAALQDLALDSGAPGPDGTRVDLRLTHQDLARLVGATRAATSLALSSLRSAGRLGFERQSAVLHARGPAACYDSLP